LNIANSTTRQLQLVEFLPADVKQVVPLLFGRATDRFEKPATSSM